MSWLLVPYTWQGPDEHGFRSTRLIEAESPKEAVNELRELVQGGDKRVWGYAADMGEPDAIDTSWSNALAYSIDWPCECGEPDCDSETDPHDMSHVTVTILPSEVLSFDSLETLLSTTKHTDDYPDNA